MANTDFAKATKKLEKFYDSTQKHEKRYKSLMSYLESVPESEQKKLFEDQFHVIYGVFQHMEGHWQSTQCVKGKVPSSSALQEYMEYLNLLKMFFKFLPDMMKKKWQATSITQLSQQLCAWENRQAIRLQGIEILFMYLDALGDQVDDKLLELMGQAVSFQTFAGAIYVLKHQELHLPADKKAIFANADGVTKPTSEESAECLDLFLRLVGNVDSVDKFKLWLERCKKIVFAELYPLACMKIGVLSADDHGGFRPNCPIVLHKVVVEHLTQWIMVQSKRDIVFSHADNVSLLLDIFEQSFVLPISMHATIQYTINTYVFLIFSPNQPALFQQYFQFYIETIVKHLDKIMSIPVVEDKYRENAMSLLEQALALNLSIAKRLKLSNATWRVLLTSLCDSVSEALSFCTEVMANHTGTSTATAPSVVPQMAEKIMETLFYLYCISDNTSENLWTHLSEMFVKHIDWREVALQWKSALVDMTKAVVNIVYRGVREGKLKAKQKAARDTVADMKPVDVSDPSPSPVPTSGIMAGSASGSFDGTAAISDPTVNLGGVDTLVPVPVKNVGSPTSYPSKDLSLNDAALANKWSIARTDYVFYRLLVVLGNTNTCRKPSAHSIYVSAIVESVGIFNEYIDSLYGYKPDDPWPKEKEVPSAPATKTSGVVDKSKTLPAPPPKKKDDKESKLQYLPQDITPIPTPCLITLYGPYLFEAASFKDSSFASSRAVAFSQLADLICKRRLQQLPTELLSHFYRLCFTSLALSAQKDGCLTFEVLRHTTIMFTLRLPGCNILLLPYLRACQWVMRANSKPSAPVDVKEKAMAFVCSIIPIPDLYSTVTLPDMQALNVRPQDGFKCVTYVSAADVKLLLFDILKTGAKNEDQGIPVSAQVMALWGLSVLVFEELLVSSERDILLITDAVETVLSLLTSTAEGVTQACVDVLDFWTQLKVEMQKFQELMCKIVVTLSSRIDDMLIDTVSGKVNRMEDVAAMFPCLVEWVIALPTEQLSQTRVWKSVFKAIERGALFDKAREVGSYDAVYNVTSAAQVDTKEPPPTPGGEGSANRPRLLAKATLAGMEPEGSVVVVAAEHALLHLLRNYNNSPSTYGIELATSSVSEFEGAAVDSLLVDPNIFIFALDNGTLVSVQEMDATNVENALGPAPPTFVNPTGAPEAKDRPQLGISDAKSPTEATKGRFVRIIVRDITGKYTWDIASSQSLEHQRYDVPCTETTPVAHPVLEIRPESVKETQKTLEEPKLSFTREPSKPVLYDTVVNSVEMRAIDVLEQNLAYFDEVDNKFVRSLSQPLHKECICLPSLDKEVKELTSKMQSQENQEVVHLTSRPPAPHIPAEPPVHVPAGADSPLSVAARMLYHLGFVRHYEINSFVKLQKSARLVRSLKELDKITPRENQKIGVIFVKKGQEDQKDILRNDSASDEFDAFVNGLGWNVSLDTHEGFLGGLDRNGTTGKQSVYFANSHFEVMFHIITRMPSSVSDLQQITKKRHVGNDIVHIVWSEHEIDYCPQTITSQFNDAHIVIYPMPGVPLCRVSIYRKKTVPFFGPLIDGMLVHRRLLPVLVRQTSMNANKVVRHQLEDYKRPYTVRRRHLEEIITRYREEQSMAEYFAMLLKPEDTQQTISKSQSRQNVQSGV